ncbi:MAG: DoxX family protein [Phenylobacterium sp.]|uniref:DoxX family protein n=1 Tax=Phenylobacterium sp. TaxID=1871053 RepID=UPI0027332A49|nr:DoxX family protein [Phenylobacterium sp.]MDP3173406.1 DoxX family protein [Phenylobacterium sp.]
MTTATPADSAAPSSGKAMLWTGRVLSAAFVLFMVMDMAIKLIGMKVVDDTMVQMGWPPELARGIGVMELIFVALYVFPRTSVLGAVLMTGVLGGAVATHVRIADPLFSHILFGVYLGLAMWGGLYLRDPRLRALFPIRR